MLFLRRESSLARAKPNALIRSVLSVSRSCHRGLDIPYFVYLRYKAVYSFTDKDPYLSEN
jgi:hypothetical protein